VRIALVIDRFDPGKGGAEAYLASFGEWLRSRGHEVAFLSQDAAPGGADATGARRIEIPGRRAPRPLRDALFLGAAAARIASFDASLGVRATVGTTVYAPHGGVYRAAARANLDSVRSAPLRVAKRAVRAVSPKHLFLGRADAAALRSERTRHLVAVSGRVARDIESALGRPDPRIRVVRNGVDLARFHPENRLAYRAPMRKRLSLADGEAALLFVAHNFRLKGIDTALAAVARLKDRARPQKLLVAGRGHRARAERLARRLGLGPGTVSFLGDVRETAGLYAAADVLVHPTFYDPASLVTLEAMASGLPVVTTREDGTSELLKPGVEGEVIEDPRDSASLAAAIERLLAPGRARRAGEAARRRAEEWPWTRNFAEMEALLGGRDG